MQRTRGNVVRWLFDSRHGPPDRLIPRWIFLRALAAIYFSAFYSLLFQIKGLIGPEGILPASHYLVAVARALDAKRYWFAPSLFWLSASSHMLMATMIVGLIASIFAFFNLWPRLSFLVCFVCFLSFVAATDVFSSYQSDGMLLEAGFLALFFAPGGLVPGWGTKDPPVRASLYLLQWEWFRIYFESGMVKLLSGDEQWRKLTAMDEYYQNGPLPTWVGWYVEHLPHWFHVASALGTLVLELGLVCMMFFPRRVRLICFFIVTPWELGVILTANYTFLNYLVLSLGFLLLDDKYLRKFVPARFRPPEPIRPVESESIEEPSLSILGSSASVVDPVAEAISVETRRATARLRERVATHARALRFAISVVMLSWIAYDTTVEMIGLPLRGVPLPTAPIVALDPFRIANQYGLFAVMTRGRYEIEFQGSNNGSDWTSYPFRYKPQALDRAPGIYAPYQPRFEWNLWFASLGDWRQNNFVIYTEARLLANQPDVLALFRSNPFPQSPPRFVRAVLWQYWFTSKDEKKRTGNWWRRQFLGLYAPEITLTRDATPGIVQWPDELPVHD
ncbi:MAG TPA: lipase maturation factor family protein [Terracidiphilus sp.]|nr:lipase maturation factor family protein [Terracidiphilus sp.]